MWERLISQSNGGLGTHGGHRFVDAEGPLLLDRG